jgi:hypothetical protein
MTNAAKAKLMTAVTIRMRRCDCMAMQEIPVRIADKLPPPAMRGQPDRYQQLRVALTDSLNAYSVSTPAEPCSVPKAST